MPNFKDDFEDPGSVEDDDFECDEDCDNCGFAGYDDCVERKRYNAEVDYYERRMEDREAELEDRYSNYEPY